LKGTAIRNKQGSITFISMMTILCGAVSLAVAVLVAGAAATLLPRQAQVAQTGLPYGRRHVNPAGGGPNTAFGKAFAANSHKLQAKKKSRLYLSKTWCAGE
jgi:hypothetical protein